jgi:hypothetical protein
VPAYLFGATPSCLGAKTPRQHAGRSAYKHRPIAYKQRLFAKKQSPIAGEKELRLTEENVSAGDRNPAKPEGRPLRAKPALRVCLCYQENPRRSLAVVTKSLPAFILLLLPSEFRPLISVLLRLPPSSLRPVFTFYFRLSNFYFPPLSDWTSFPKPLELRGNADPRGTSTPDY